MALFGPSTNGQDKLAEEIALLRTEFGQEIRVGLTEIRGLQAELRQQLGASLDSGVQDLRDELRELRRELNDAHKSITEARRDSESLRLELETTRRQAAEAQREIVPEGAPTTVTKSSSTHEDLPGSSAEAPGQTPPAARHHVLDPLLEQAAGVSAADLVCHRDAWAFIVEQASRNSHFRVPELVAHDHHDEQTTVTLSGRTLIAVLSALHTTQNSQSASREDRALASTYYGRISDVVASALPSHSGSARMRIVVDDRPPSAAEG
ncbi:hypothetical protein ACIRD3_34335 [Kitasatospora sp. NPDC093550]|uniref:hypothetical protein n=1 Tax=Kitasatospora sp. NPDC093550 TaxID=3364089 RepID=UPI00382175CB